MECAASTPARAVFQRAACRPGRAFCNRRESRRAARRRLSAARPRRPWRSPPRKPLQAPSRSIRAPAGYHPQATALPFCALPYSSRAPLWSLPPMEVPALPAGLLGENDVRDFHPLIEGFAHVVDCEGRGGNGDQGFHFHARLGGRDSRDPRHFQRIPLRVFQPPDRAHHSRLHFHKTPCRRRSCRHRFLRHIDHPHFALLSVVRKLCHTREPRPRPSSVTRKRSRRSRSFRGLPAPPESNSPSKARQYRPSPATLTLSLPLPRHPNPRARAKNAPARVFPSMPRRAEPRPTARRAPPHRSTNQSRAPQTIRTSPSSKRDSPANRTPACPGTFQTRPVSPAESPPHRKKIPLP